MDRFPFKPRDWVFDGNRVAQVKDVWWDGEAVLLDLYLYDRNGKRTGRESPAMGGPKNFEPACDAKPWQRIDEPTFPVPLKWVTDEKGVRTAKHVAGKPLPPANWRRPTRKVGVDQRLHDDKMRRALEEIAAGHNDARRVAKEALS